MRKAAGLAVAVWMILPTVAQAQIKVGITGPLSGSNKAYGIQFKNGAIQAIEDINDAGGILGQRVTFQLGDDLADPDVGVVVANKFVKDKVNYVIGHNDSDVTLKASVIYQDAGMLEVTPSSTNTEITERGMWNVFRTCGRDDQQGDAAGTYIVQNYKGKNVAILHNKTRYGEGLAGYVKASINAHGMNEVLFDGIDPGEKEQRVDYSDTIQKLKDLKVDLVYLGSEHKEAGYFLAQMRSEGVMAKMMGGDGLSAEDFAKYAGSAAEGTLMTFAPDPRLRREAQDVVERFRARRIEPEAYTLYSYAAMQVIKQGIEMAKSLDSRKIAAQILTGAKFKTVVGDLTYDKKGDITRYDYVMYVWKPDPGGKLTYTEIR
jgi:branched-chain amino acid transport system substrate-binding protein